MIKRESKRDNVFVCLCISVCSCVLVCVWMCLGVCEVVNERESV